MVKCILRFSFCTHCESSPGVFPICVCSCHVHLGSDLSAVFGGHRQPTITYFCVRRPSAAMPKKIDACTLSAWEPSEKQAAAALKKFQSMSSASKHSMGGCRRNFHKSNPDDDFNKLETPQQKQDYAVKFLAWLQQSKEAPDLIGVARNIFRPLLAPPPIYTKM